MPVGTAVRVRPCHHHEWEKIEVHATDTELADAPAEQDYPAAASLLRLIAAPALAESLSSLLSRAPLVHQAAKDILRAARLPLLPADDLEVTKDLKKVSMGTPLSPVLHAETGVRLGAGRAAQLHVTWRRSPLDSPYSSIKVQCASPSQPCGRGAV
jgi:hypothetical protein